LHNLSGECSDFNQRNPLFTKFQPTANPSMVGKLLALPLARSFPSQPIPAYGMRSLPRMLLIPRALHDLKTGTITGPHALPGYEEPY